MNEKEVEKTGNERKENYQLFIDERKLLIEALRESYQTFDKAMLALTSGAFGFTIAFLKDIAPKPYANTLCLLSTSWVFFGLSLVLILLSFLFSQEACKESIEVAYDVIVEKKERTRPMSLITKIFNYSSIVALIIAILTWGLFAFFNIHFTK